MHLLLTERRGLEALEAPRDLGQKPAEITILSFAESDLAAFARAWKTRSESGEERPQLRLANLAALRHPFSVDLFLENFLPTTRAVLVRLIGGVEAWRYGLEELSRLARAHSLALAVIGTEAEVEEPLAAFSTVDRDTLAALAALAWAGGTENAARALDLLLHLAGLAPPPATRTPERLASAGLIATRHPPAAWGEVAIILYRAHHLAGDTAPAEALAAALADRGIATRLSFVHGLKDAESRAFLAAELAHARPDAVLTLTGFAARGTGGSPLEVADAPLLQLVLASTDRKTWAELPRGLAPADLAMQVVLPEMDGRLQAGLISFKEAEPAAFGLDWPLHRHTPDPAKVALAAQRIAGWVRLARTPAAERRLAFILSDYPGLGGQRAQAVGLDTLGSLSVMLGMLTEEGYETGPSRPDREGFARLLCEAEPTPYLSLESYRSLLAGLPAETAAQITTAWGPPENDPAVRDGYFTARFWQSGQMIAAIQPDRGWRKGGLTKGDVMEEGVAEGDRRALYHDLAAPPRHAYVAFYLWLREVQAIHALVHVGAHGTLEWLPGKAAALSEACFPAALLGGVPVIYPFIVNNPGEAAVAKRRLGALTLGHLTPPLIKAGLSGEAAILGRLLEDYGEASGLDPKRAEALRTEILERAASAGLLEECGANQAPSPEERLARVDAYLCDIKESLIRAGLHVFGTQLAPDREAEFLEALAEGASAEEREAWRALLSASPAAERRAFLRALDGRFVPPGPAGAPSQGRREVLPTGRNLHGFDPRLVPTPTAWRLATARAADLLTRHLQETGEWPRRIVLDLWGSASLRTAGEEFALALALIGVAPVWEEASGQVREVEVIPLARLDRPRIDVTLRISGLFRDLFAPQIALFDLAVGLLRERDESPDFNPFKSPEAAGPRIFGPASGCYGSGVDALLAAGALPERAALARAYQAHSAVAHSAQGETPDPEAFRRRLGAADLFLHLQDLPETDILDQLERAAHIAGFAALSAEAGASPRLAYGRLSSKGGLIAETVEQAAMRALRVRAANPRWIEAQRAHGYQGAGEIARNVESLALLALGTGGRFDQHFDLLFTATLGDEETAAFLASANRAAFAAMRRRFAELLARGLWRPRLNWAAARLTELGAGEDGE
jgi:cobaltochelatase CobN